MKATHNGKLVFVCILGVIYVSDTEKCLEHDLQFISFKSAIKYTKVLFLIFILQGCSLLQKRWEKRVPFPFGYLLHN